MENKETLDDLDKIQEIKEVLSKVLQLIVALSSSSSLEDSKKSLLTVIKSTAKERGFSKNDFLLLTENEDLDRLADLIDKFRSTDIIIKRYISTIREYLFTIKPVVIPSTKRLLEYLKDILKNLPSEKPSRHKNQEG